MPAPAIVEPAHAVSILGSTIAPRSGEHEVKRNAILSFENNFAEFCIKRRKVDSEIRRKVNS